MNLRAIPADLLAETTEDDLVRAREPSLAPPTEVEWWRLFEYKIYDWDDPEFKKKNRGKYAYVPIMLTQDYFGMASPRDAKKFLDSTWHANVQKLRGTDQIVRVYARRCKPKHRNVFVYMHIDVAKSGSLAFVDHVNGYGLDNRRPNLKTTKSQSENMANQVGKRTKHFGLPQGTYRTKSGKFQARLNYTIRGKQYEKNKNFATMEAAVAWREKERKKLYKRSAWADTPKSVNYPIFPPLKPEYQDRLPEDILALLTAHIPVNSLEVRL